MLKVNTETKILYVSSEKFTNEFVSAIKSGKTKDFKDRYRSVDLLLIDDIQFIGGKEQTQEEFFHTFNELHQQGKQVVLSSDRPPKAIPALEDRLRSRFEWGMIADISHPDLETRAAILQAKAQEKKFLLSAELTNLVAATVQSNIRELEGALNKIIAFHELKNTEPTKESIKSILTSFESQNMRKSLTPKDLLSTVCDFFDVAQQDILGKSREKRLSFPRQIIMFLLREELKLSYPAIGTELGGRDHTTAMHAHTKIQNEVENDMKLKQDMEMIKQRLYTSIN
jgi:chromosomal replication initiator protein